MKGIADFKPLILFFMNGACIRDPKVWWYIMNRQPPSGHVPNVSRPTPVNSCSLAQ